MKSTPIMIMGGVIGVLLVMAGLDLFIFSPSPEEPSPAEPPAQPVEARPSPPPPSAPAQTSTPSPSPALPAPEPAQPPPEPPAKPLPLTLEQNMEKLRKAAAEVCATGQSREIALAFTQAEANAQGARLLAQTEMPPDIPAEIKGVYIDFKPGNTVLTEIEAAALVLTFKIKVESQVGIKDGKPTVAVTKVSFGFLPSSLKDRIAGLVRQKTEALLRQVTDTELGCDGKKVDAVYTNINIQEEEAVVTIQLKLRA